MAIPSFLSDPDALIKALLSSVRRAGAAILDIYHSDFSVDQKADMSPVTQADRVAEALILQDLVGIAPQVPVVAEESVAEGRVPVVDEAPFWLVDPLDGTREFVERNGEFTVNIGLVIQHRPVLGVIYAPACDVLYWGWGGRGCYREQGGQRQGLSARFPGEGGLVVLSSRSHASQDERDYLASLQVASRLSVGSSLKFCHLAAGEGDLYPRFGPTCEWDTCAGHAILLAAGGTVAQPDGAPLLYGKTGFRNSFFIATGRRGV